jgi:hypothetical protein
MRTAAFVFRFPSNQQRRKCKTTQQNNKPKKRSIHLWANLCDTPLTLFLFPPFSPTWFLIPHQMKKFDFTHFSPIFLYILSVKLILA